MEIAPASLAWQSFNKLMLGSIVPRPIGWISTVTADGQHNLAPFSFFNAVCANPPHVLFCPGIRGRDNAHKDTLNNLRATGEFVVNIVTFPLAEAMNITSGEYAADVDEFEIAKLTPAPSLTVRPRRVAESPIHFECKVAQIIEVSEEPGGGSIVIGRVTHAHVADHVLIGEDKIDTIKLQPIGRLAGASYCRVSELFDMERPKV
jgi:flavin reductase (DIM6/NTAB) family NADH-FMN oxidoreductase RutF